MTDFTFDLDKARAAGASDEQIAKELSKRNEFDYDSALEQGASPGEVINFFMNREKGAEDLAREAAKEDESMADWLFNPQTPIEEMSLGRVLTSGAVGAGVSFPFGGPKAAAAGFVTGLASGAAGEIARAQGQSRAATFAYEAGGGLIPGMIQKLGRYYLNRSLVNRETAELASSLLKPEITNETRAIIKAKEKLFGPDTFKGSATTAHQDNAQGLLREKFNLLGQSEKKVSTILREKMLKGIDDLGEKTTETIKVVKPAKKGPLGTTTAPVTEVVLKRNVFFNSPQFKNLLDDLKTLAEKGTISGEDLGEVIKISKNSLSKNPKVAKDSAEDLLNFIQNRGIKESKQEIGGVPVKNLSISSSTQDLLRKHFDDFLVKNSDEISYNTLKAVEKQEFAAAAVDSIPQLLLTNFKYGAEEVTAALKNINNFQGGKELFRKSLDQHFKKFGPKVELSTLKLGEPKIIGKNLNVSELISEFVRLRPMIKESKILTDDELLVLSKTLSNLPKKVTNEKVVYDVISNSLKTSRSIISGEAPSAYESITERDATDDILNMFSL